jgi:hypothetical protein
MKIVAMFNSQNYWVFGLLVELHFGFRFVFVH